MDCTKIRELMEEYITGELEPIENDLIEQHLKTCSSCEKEYDETRNVIERIRALKKSIKTKEDILAMNRKNIMKRATNKKETTYRRRGITGKIPVIAAALLCIITVFAGSALTFPAFASNYASMLPVVREMNRIMDENTQFVSRLEDLQAENEELKMELVKIKGQEIKQVNTSDTVSQEERLAVQQLAVDFIIAQYKGDIELIKTMCTESFKSWVDGNRNAILWRKNGEAIFTQITNVAKEGDRYLVFVRLNETGSNGEADYQENFEIVKVNGKYLVDFMGNDA